MIRSLFLAAILAISSASAQAVPIGSGEVLRGNYTVPGSNLQPQSFLLRLGGADLFGNGDSVAVSFLDSALTRLTSTTFSSVGTSLDPTVGIGFGVNDFLPGVLPRVPNSGFIEITALAGSFDVSAIDLFALDLTFPGVPLQRQARVSEFQLVETEPTPVAVPAPGSAGLLLVGLTAFAAMRRRL